MIDVDIFNYVPMLVTPEDYVALNWKHDSNNHETRNDRPTDLSVHKICRYNYVKRSAPDIMHMPYQLENNKFEFDI